MQPTLTLFATVLLAPACSAFLVAPAHPAAPHAVAAAQLSTSMSLVNSLERVSSWRGKVVVVKYGGHAMTNDERAAEFASDIALMQSLGVLPVVVHGGGPQINAMLEKLEVQSEFVNGLRKTTPEVMQVVEMVLCGMLNKKIASAINVNGGRAVGLSGKDDNLVTAKQRDPALGLVGDVTTVAVPLIHSLLDAGITPVIAPVATDATGASYNAS